MTLILQIAVLLSFIICYCLSSLYDYHMFQLNSYKPATHLKWIAHNFYKAYLLRHILILPIFGAAFFHSYAAAAVSSALFLIQAYCNRPRKAKKPLVFTNRVKRMLVTNILASGALAACSFSLPLPLQIALLALIVLLSPFFTLLSNLINTPIEKGVNQWYINDAKRILRGMKNLTIIGITGSYGKTSTKYFLHKILSVKYNVLMTPESYNTPMGVVKTIRSQLRPFHDIFICEMGAKYVGEIKEICDIVHPKHGILTSIGPQHLETFKTLENIIRTKFELAEALPKDGILFLNYENEYIRNTNCNTKKISYALSVENSDYTARNISASGEGCSFDLQLSDGKEYRFVTKLLGLHNVENIAGCIATADYLGVPPADMVTAVRRLESVPHRLQLLNRSGMTIIDDAFNSNIRGAMMALDALNTFDGFKILVTPGMVELGDKQDSYNRDFGTKAAELCDFVILVGARQTAPIAEGLRGAGYSEEKLFIAETIEGAFKKIGLINSAGKRKVALLENDLPDNY
ncbi:UDP-N-acetylmuramyl pentapeptide synthase [Treponema primitia ZAS-2]|uniref:UDP-N-acetylmuramyl pentapeptide synthase n=1 Tax=Treponema primitia (strain ATCC BAA-887 / DSM 12427 / ZAS-2) TaxID=545694 RepID=F5YN17_TREPZ|nr:UDP-N-acetylmuramoyl-tripeptide--D-alanyl-D-alanine ligase [Treponema primitia]AEF86466.1 UDP-N-acetylmuramyl pentapeptide synthase [Treponema primitia ZAS-2]